LSVSLKVFQWDDNNHVLKDQCTLHKWARRVV
jgi:hypothetical protein